MLDLLYLFAYVAAFNVALLVCYGIVRGVFALLGRDWTDY